MRSVSELHHHDDDLLRLLQEAEQINADPTVRRRLHALIHALDCGNVSQTCRRFSISRSAFYDCLRRFDPSDLSSLEDRPPIPKRVRQPEADERVIELVSQYREALLPKEEIAKRLEREHAISISASTVGRIIRRHRFFFADTPAHRKKRGEGDTGPTHPGLVAIILVASVLAGSLGLAGTAHAAEGSRFRLYGDFDHYAQKDAADGSSFRTTEAGVTNLGKPLQGSRFQLITGTPEKKAAQESAQQESTAAPIGGGRSCRIPGTGPGPCTREQIVAYFAQGRQRAAAPAEGTQPRRDPAERTQKRQQRDTPQSTFPTEPPPLHAAPTDDTATPPTDPLPKKADGSDAATILQGESFSKPSAPPLPTGNVGGATRTALPALLILLLEAAVVGGMLIRRRRTVRILPGGKEAWTVRPLYPAPQLLHRHRARSICICALLIATALLLSLLLSSIASAATTTPLTHTYHGHLLDTSGNAVTTEHTIRFSYWTSVDSIAGDVTNTGAIDTGAANYAGWSEEHTVTPNSDGYFSVELGSITALPTMDSLSVSTLTSLHLQVEVKESAAEDHTYDLLDHDTSDPEVDRSPVLSVPFAANANMLDQRGVGTGSGSIPLLGSGGSLTLDNGSTTTGSVTLQFGQTLLKKLSFDVSHDRFTFNDEVLIGGNVTVTGSLVITNSGSLTASGALATESGVILNLRNEAKDAVLSFGNALAAETLTFLDLEHRFEFSDDVHSTGGLTTSGSLTVESASRIKAGLDVEGTASGTHVHAEDLLTSSGGVVVEGNVRFNSGMTLVGSTTIRGSLSGSTVQGGGGLATITSTGSMNIEGTFTSSRATDIGWSIVSQADQACNTTCTNACVAGFADDVTGQNAVSCSDASADRCLCAGGS